MNDFELNKAIMWIVKSWKGATITNNENPNAIGHTETLFIQGAKIGISTYFVDYCNSWDDLMPLVVEHNISFNCYAQTNEWHAFVFPVGTNNENPQRALAECLLKVLTENKLAEGSDK